MIKRLMSSVKVGGDKLTYKRAPISLLHIISIVFIFTGLGYLFQLSRGDTDLDTGGLIFLCLFLGGGIILLVLLEFFQFRHLKLWFDGPSLNYSISYTHCIRGARKGSIRLSDVERILIESKCALEGPVNSEFPITVYPKDPKIFEPIKMAFMWNQDQRLEAARFFILGFEKGGYKPVGYKTLLAAGREIELRFVTKY
ncbi:MAG: hypothetical protein JXB14_05835 [Candidatus Altiarchaeota archaeon]|nr:hypothetical protein [Candidatus Altiarchaeota archaeon]